MAKRVEDLRQYWQDIATKAGLSADAIASISDTLGDDAAVRAFRQAFVPVAEHHSTLDEMRSNVDAERARLQNWYDTEALPAYQTNLKGIERLRQYETAYGELDPASATTRNASDFGFKNREELDKYLDDRSRARDAGLAGLAKIIPQISIDYFNRFHEVLDINEVEKVSVAKGLSPEMAYKEYIAPKVEEAREASFVEKLKAAKEEGRREALSSRNLPVDSTPKDSSPFFGREEPAKDTSPMAEDRASRGAFLDGWNNYAESIANKNHA